MKGLFSKGCVMIGAALALGSVVPAVASASPIPCPQQQFSQPFLSWHDSGWYTLLGGQSAGNFNGAGWSLSGGAKVLSTTLRDGSVGHVLDVPSGGVAVSPPICVNSAYPLARAEVRDLVGHGGVLYAITFADVNGAWRAGSAIGVMPAPVAGWGLSRNLMLPTRSFGRNVAARFTLLGTGWGREYQVYDFYVDPKMRW